MKSKLFVALTLLALVALPAFGDAYNEGVVYTLGSSNVVAGDIVICEQASPCSYTDPSTWSDVLVYYNSSVGPFTPDTSADANSVVVFSDGLSGYYSLANFVANSLGIASVPNGTTEVENTNGITDYSLNGVVIGQVNSAEPTPEPGMLSLMGIGLAFLGMRLFRLKWAQ